MIPNKLVDSHYGPMIVNAQDRYIGRSLEQFGSWASDDIELIKSILEIQLQDKPQVCFFDVGANIGTHTVALAKYFGDRIRIRSFEAQRQVYYLLCGNVALNGLDNVICEHCAVGDKINDVIEMQLPDYTQENNFGGFELLPPRHSDNQDMIKLRTETVPVTTIDSFVDAIDFVKLDVEGMEHLVLYGARKTFAQHRPICFLEVLKTEQDKIISFFSQLDYEIFIVRKEDWIAVPKDSDVDLDLPKLVT